MSEISSDHSSIPLQYAPAADRAGAAGVQIGYVGLKLLGIYFIVQIVGLIWILGAWVNVGQPQSHKWLMVIVSGLPTILQAGIGVLLFVKAGDWSIRCFGGADVSLEPVSRSDVMVLTISGIGIWLVAGALPGLCAEFANLISSAWRLNSFYSSRSSYWGYEYQNIIRSASQIIIGTAMFVAGKLKKPSPGVFTPGLGSDPSGDRKSRNLPKCASRTSNTPNGKLRFDLLLFP